jgi:DNA invertase Pin-like site-specific DNA recombinase
MTDRQQKMPVKRASATNKSRRVFGHPPGKRAKTALRAGLAHARTNGKRLGRPLTAALQSDPVCNLRRSELSKSAMARQLNIGRTSVRRILNRRTQG